MHARRKNLASARSRGGFTLLELLIVAMLGILVMTFISSTWKWYGRSVNEIHVSAQLMRELKLAAESIAQDHGPALAARTVDGTTVQFDFDSVGGDGTPQWAAPDTVIEYVRENGRLVRKNLDTDATLPLADHITDMAAEMVGGHLQIRLVAGFRKIEQDLTLQLQEP